MTKQFRNHAARRMRALVAAGTVAGMLAVGAGISPANAVEAPAALSQVVSSTAQTPSARASSGGSDARSYQATANTSPWRTSLAGGQPSFVSGSKFIRPMFWGILVKIVKQGLKSIGKLATRNSVQSGAKKYLLSLGSNTWKHIMNPKHNWGKVGAKTKNQVADIMSQTMAKGTHSKYGTSGAARQAQMKYKGNTVVVTYAASSKKISNGWVK